MSAYQVMPRLTSDEYIELEQSIRDDGVLVPIIVSEDGEIVDGHHRAEIARKHGLDCPRVVKHGTETELRTFAYSLNLHRRHLSREQKRELIADSLRSDPQLSNSEHARRTGASDKTVNKHRDDMESRSEIPNADTRTDSFGREQPAAKPRPAPEFEPPAPLTVHDAVAEFPELAHYTDTNRPQDALRLAAALRGYAEPERSMRRDNLRRKIAAEQRATEAPSVDVEPDYERLAAAIFESVNAASSAIKRHGGIDTMTAATATADHLLIETWNATFLDASEACAALAAATRPTLRRVK